MRGASEYLGWMGGVREGQRRWFVFVKSMKNGSENLSTGIIVFSATEK